MDIDALINAALASGASGAEMLSPSQLVVSDSFRLNCASNACGNYGRNWSCPPEIGDINDLIAKLKPFPHIMLYQLISTLEDSYDIEGMNTAGEKLSEIGQKLQTYLKKTLCKPFLHLSGACRLCSKCAKLTNSPCRFPDKMLPSMSAYGVDVYNTGAKTSLKYINGQNTVTYFGMVLFEE